MPSTEPTIAGLRPWFARSACDFLAKQQGGVRKLSARCLTVPGAATQVVSHQPSAAQQASVTKTMLTAKGYRLIHDARTEPWTQITARLLSLEGLLVAVCYTPSFHDACDS